MRRFHVRSRAAPVRNAAAPRPTTPRGPLACSRAGSRTPPRPVHPRSRKRAQPRARRRASLPQLPGLTCAGLVHPRSRPSSRQRILSWPAPDPSPQRSRLSQAQRSRRRAGRALRPYGRCPSTRWAGRSGGSLWRQPNDRYSRTFTAEAGVRRYRGLPRRRAFTPRGGGVCRRHRRNPPSAWRGAESCGPDRGRRQGLWQGPDRGSCPGRRLRQVQVRPLRRHHGPVRFREADPAALRGRPRQPHLRQGLHRRRRPEHAERPA